MRRKTQVSLSPRTHSGFNVSNELKPGLWKVVTLTKPLTATILHRACEQLPTCQCLTEIIAVPTGSFGRQMAEATPFICQQPFHNSHCPVRPRWESKCSLANYLSSLDGCYFKDWFPLEPESCSSSPVPPGQPLLQHAFRNVYGIRKSRFPKSNQPWC